MRKSNEITTYTKNINNSSISDKSTVAQVDKITEKDEKTQCLI